VITPRTFQDVIRFITEFGGIQSKGVRLTLTPKTTHMEYSRTYLVKEEHIDVQGIMDGLYYPFYMEWCRHDFIREVLGFDFETEANNGIHMVLSNYSLHFIRSLKKGDEFSVTCEVFKDKGGLPKLHFKQSILIHKKVVTKAIFSGTCVPASGGRPYLPGIVLEQLKNVPELDVAHMI
jgi:acyl-CoA thioester hydrolase